jgi:hypothetical protein
MSRQKLTFFNSSKKLTFFQFPQNTQILSTSPKIDLCSPLVVKNTSGNFYSTNTGCTKTGTAHQIDSKMDDY